MATLPYGSWPSPISAASLVEGKVGIAELITDGDDVWWSESRPDEGGRIAVVRWRDGVTEEITPAHANVRTSVHEYGGGAWWVDGGALLFVDFADQRLRMRSDDGETTLLTPEPAEPRALRYADFRFTPDRRWVVCVREVHGDERAHNEPDNELVAIATDGSGDIRVLASGHDFYAAPRPSPDGGCLAWLQWNHPDMPWDGTELWVADLEDGAVTNARLVAGGRDESVNQPEWSPTGELHFVSDRSGRSNLYRLLDDGSEMIEVGGEFDVAGPMWVFGQSRYAIDPEGHLVVAMKRPAADALLVDKTSHVHGGWSAIRSVRTLTDGTPVYVVEAMLRYKALSTAD